MIKYKQSTVASRPTFRTEKFGNLLSDTYQGEVSQSNEDGTWQGWRLNWSTIGDSVFRFGFKSRGAATRWVNDKLREIGVK